MHLDIYYHNIYIYIVSCIISILLGLVYSYLLYILYFIYILYNPERVLKLQPFRKVPPFASKGILWSGGAYFSKCPCV